MTMLRDKETGAVLGSISSHQLRFLFDQLEEESAADTDYYVTRATLELLANQGIDPQLLGILREALGSREEMEIEWSRGDGEPWEPEADSVDDSIDENGREAAIELAVNASDAAPYLAIFESTRSDVTAQAEAALEGARIPFTSITLNPFTGLRSLSVPVGRVAEGRELLAELENGGGESR